LLYVVKTEKRRRLSVLTEWDQVGRAKEELPCLRIEVPEAAEIN
jgi:hypothetical protein